MMQVPGSIMQFLVSARSVKHEVGDMIDILSRQEEEALHVAYDRGNINRIKTVVDRDITEAYNIGISHVAAGRTESTVIQTKVDIVPEEVENIKLLRAEEDSTTWIKWGPGPSHSAKRKITAAPGRRQKKARTPTYIGARHCEWKMINSPRFNQTKKARKLHISTRIEPTPDLGDHG